MALILRVCFGVQMRKREKIYFTLFARISLGIANALAVLSTHSNGEPDRDRKRRREKDERTDTVRKGE